MTFTDKDKRRFNKFLKLDVETGCLLYIGYKDKDGYGRFCLNYSKKQAHRVAWAMAGNEFTSDMILHHCDTPACCNLAHLWEGTAQDNQFDKANKRRGSISRSGLPLGVYLSPNGRKFIAKVTYSNTTLAMGTYTTLEEATVAVNDCRKGLGYDD